MKNFPVLEVVAIIAILLGCSRESPVQVSMNDTDSKSAQLSNFSEGCPPETNDNIATMIASTDPNYYGNLEMIRRGVNGKLQHFWWNMQQTCWVKQAEFADGINTGKAAGLCSNLNDNLLQVLVNGDAIDMAKLVHYYRTADHQWVRECTFGENECYGSPALICNNQNKLLQAFIRTSSSTNNYIRCYTRSSDGTWSKTKIFLNKSSYAVHSDPVVVQDVNGVIHLLVHTMSSSSVYSLEYYKIRTNGKVIFVQRISGLAYYFKPAVTIHNGTHLSVLVKKNDDQNKIIEYYHNGSGFLTENSNSIVSTPAGWCNASAVTRYSASGTQVWIEFYLWGSPDRNAFGMAWGE